MVVLGFLFIITILAIVGYMIVFQTNEDGSDEE